MRTARRMVLCGAAIASLVVGPFVIALVAGDQSVLGGVAYAQGGAGGGKGHGGGGPGGGKGQGGGEAGKGGAGGGKSVPAAVGRGSGGPSGGGPGGSREASGDKISGQLLSRLNAVRAFMSPGFDPSQIIAEGELESPLFNLAMYQLELQSANPDLEQAGIYLGNVAKITVSTEVVEKVDSFLGVSCTPAEAVVIAAAAEEQRLSLKENHEE